MPVISIKDNNNPKLAERRIMGILHDITGVRLTGFRKNQKGFAVQLANYEDKIKYLDTATREALSIEGIEVVKPPDYRAKCTFIINNASRFYRRFGEDGLKEEIEEGIGCKVINMTLMGERLRVELNSPEEAQRVLEARCIETENFTTRDIDPQRYSRVPQCPRCFSYAHGRVDCPSSEQLCFICAEPGHDDISCPNKENPKCRNCHQDHVAIAFKCPFRKVRLLELDERADCDLESLIIVDQMRRFHGEKGPSSNEDESSEGRSDTFEGAAAGPENAGEGAVAAPESSSPERRSAGAVFETLVTFNFDALQSFLDQSRGLPSQLHQETVEKKSWKTVRILKAPDPRKGEGPCRRCRKVENFQPPLNTEPTATVTFPVLPPRPLRKITA